MTSHLTRLTLAASVAFALAGAGAALAADSAPEVDALLKRVAVTPADALAHNELGVALVTLGDNERGQRHLWLAVLLDEGFPPAWSNLAWLQRKAKRHEAAIAAFGKSLTLDASQPEDWYGAAGSLRSLKRTPESMFALQAFLERAADEHPKRQKVERVVATWAERGTTPVAPKWPTPEPPSALVEVAAKAKADAESKGPDAPVTPTPAATEEPKPAEDATPRPAAKPEPTAPPENAAKPTSATEPKEAATAEPKDTVAAEVAAPSVPSHEGDAAFASQHYLDALSAYRAEAASNPEDGVLLYKLGATLAILGDPTGALRAWRRVLRQAPARVILNRQIAFATRRLSDWGMTKTGVKAPEDVVTAAREALLAHDPARVLALTRESNLAEALFFRGEAALRLGKLDQALLAFERGLNLAPDDRGLQGGRVEVLIQQGRVEAKDAVIQWMEDPEATEAAFMTERALMIARRIKYGAASTADDEELE